MEMNYIGSLMNNNKIKIIGLRNIPFNTYIENQKDYLVKIMASLDEIRTRPSQGEEPDELIFVLKALFVDSIEEVGTHKEIPIKKGYTPSQILRFAILDYLRKKGLDDSEENYEKEMRRIIDYYSKDRI